MKKIFVGLLAVGAFFLACTNQKTETSVKKTMVNAKSIHDFKVESLEGKTIDFADFKGKKILVVNTASKCGFTPQYANLEKLYQQYKEKLVVVGFPADNFGHQEPGNNEEIGAFCQKNYGVTFPMASKISVKGDDIAPIYEFLTKKDLNGVKNTAILWNFTKILLDENGRVIDSFLSTTTPSSESITRYLK